MAARLQQNLLLALCPRASAGQGTRVTPQGLAVAEPAESPRLLRDRPASWGGVERAAGAGQVRGRPRGVRGWEEWGAANAPATVGHRTPQGGAASPRAGGPECDAKVAS